MGPARTLFKTKSVYFATLFKTRDLYILLVSCVVSLFKTQDSENHTLLSGTYPLRPNKGVPPRGGGILSVRNLPQIKGDLQSQYIKVRTRSQGCDNEPVVLC